MRLQSLIPELMVKEVEQSARFYADVLGFRVDARAPEEGVATWAELANGTCRIMLQRRAELVLEMPFLAERLAPSTTIIVLRCSRANVRDFASKHSAAVGKCIPMRETDYGTVEAGLFDPDGHVVQLSGIDE